MIQLLNGFIGRDINAAAQQFGFKSASQKKAHTRLPVLTTNSVSLTPWHNRSLSGIGKILPAVAANGDINGDGFGDVVIGGPAEGEGRGQVTLFLGSSRGVPNEPSWSFRGNKPNQHFGVSVALADVDGDGKSDLIVSDCEGDLDNNNTGNVYIFSGSSKGLEVSPSQIIPNKVGAFRLGFVLAAAGDVNGDGCVDLVVLANAPGEQPARQCAALLFQGSRQGISMTPTWIAYREQVGTAFGTSLACVGDVNGDGFDDFLIGDMMHNGRFRGSGKAYLYLGSRDGLQNKPAWIMEYPLEPDPRFRENQFFGCGAGPAGDVNGDGFDDVVIGAWFASQTEKFAGAAFLFYGSPSGLEKKPAWQVVGDHSELHLGAAVGSIGDINRDGYSDIIIGAPYAEHEDKDQGTALVFYGSKSGLCRIPAWTFDGDRPNCHLGERVGSAGDVNGDGIPDFFVAGIDWSDTRSPRTHVAVIYGSRGGLTASSNWRLTKPPLAAIERAWERASPGAIWLSLISLACGIVIALALFQAKLRVRLAILIRENQEIALHKERARLARDIHDNLGADLTRLALELEQTRKLAPTQGFDERLERLSSCAGRTLKTVRELVWATTPECDSVESLAMFVSEEAASFLESNGLSCDLEFPLELPERKVSSEFRHNFLLMVKEVLTNIVKHANATEVRLRLNIYSAELSLVISDDGRGFNLDEYEQAAAPGYTGKAGLRNMRARANALGGNCSIESHPGHGTSVTLVLPTSDLTNEKV